MDRTLVYTKTPAGEEATRQRTRVVQRNLRMVLLQVDGQLNVDGLVAKIGNESLVFGALRELEKGGYIALSSDAPSVWEQGVQKVRKIGAAASAQISQLSSFGPSVAEPLDDDSFEPSIMSQSSVFGSSKAGKAKTASSKTASSAPVQAPASASNTPEYRPLPPVGNWVRPKSWQERLTESLAAVLGRLKGRAASSSGGKAVESPAVSGKDLAPFRRKSWPFRIAVAVVAVLLATILVILFYPYDSHRASLEASLGRMSGMPVRIGAIDVEMLPRPSLVLRNVRFGAGDEARVGKILVPQILSLAGSGSKVIATAELQDASFHADFLAYWPRLVNGMRENRQLAVEHLRFSETRLRAAGVEIGGLAGELALKAGEGQGRLALFTADRSLRFELAPSASGAEVVIQSPGWKPAEGSPYEFSMMFMRGLLQPGKLSLNNAEFGMAYGVFRGSWQFEWGGDKFAMSGSGNLSNFDTQRLLAVFSVPLQMNGRLSGNLVLAGAGKDWGSMWKNVDATLNTVIEHGVISGIDLGEAIRRGAGREVSGGQTRFERLNAELSITSRQVSSSSLRIDSGMVSASGRFVAGKDHRVDGDLLMTIQGSAAPVRAGLRVSGRLPVLQTAVAQ